ncbi:MAG TPA: efflux RND transporter periplasmic adaptor subunit [Candidatus Limnocylindria bacterium]|nr:efflux RND transporter periplasmic adaptor subunit [Candidatus Limnocylindria bacterium]
MTARLVALLAALSLAAGCGDEAGSTPERSAGPPPAVVETVTVQPTTIVDRVALVGQLEAEDSVLLKPEIDGVVEEILFQDGQEVEGGALLVRLRDDWQRAVLAEAEADFALARRAFERGRQLHATGVLAEAEEDRLRAEYDAARARVDRARVDLARTVVRAPFAGVLGRRLVSPGDRVSRDTALVQLDAVARLKLVFTVPEMAIRAVRVGAPVELHVGAWPGETFAGEVFFVAPMVDPQTRRAVVQAMVPNPERKLRPGFFANLDAELDRRETALVVPESALVHDAAGAFVWRIEPDGTAARAPVTPGIRREGQVEITSGLRAGDRVVSVGTHKLAPGTPVRVLDGDDAGSDGDAPAERTS